MKTWTALVIGFSAMVGLAHSALAEMRSWTDASGGKLEAEYVRSTDKAVTLRKANMQNVIVPLDKLSAEDQAYIAELQKAELEAKLVKVKVQGDIVWVLGGWRSMSLSNQQSGEIWTWDDKEKKPKTKITDIDVLYDFNLKGRDEITGHFETKEPIALNPDEKIVVLSSVKFGHNNKQREEKDTSIPMTLPQVKDNMIKLPTVRASAR